MCSSDLFVYEHKYDVVKDTIAATTYARDIGKKVDGNAAEIFGADLAAHIICGGTDISCHETTSKEECMEKLRYGVYVLMREGSTQSNMPECIKALTEEGLSSRRMLLATDDMLAEDIIKKPVGGERVFWEKWPGTAFPPMARACPYPD